MLRLPSPLGTIEVAWRETGLTWLALGAPDPLHGGPDPFGVEAALLRYFSGELHALDHLPVAPEGTELQLAVWAALREIPPGETRTYADLARMVGRNARSARAVGTACGHNPVALVVPCHRVIGNDGDLTGFAWGKARKRWLLIHEKALRQQSLGL